ncbi:lactonase family protein [Bifidobacterium colobi]|uniref:lactonase family protein n=1 Tax=Bifidobacterium colobi TaxID=2809026 RepID=UPI001F0B078C|nr:beta-propeller fold lactonase family protein [Bifidobacterium colobi]
MIDSTAMNNDVFATVLTGGFGALRGSSCPGIEAVQVTTASNDSAALSVALQKNGVLAEVSSPTWMTRDGDLLYAVLEDTNEVAAFRIASAEAGNDLHLAELSRVATPGASPTHAVVCTDDSGARHLIVACYADGHVCVHPIAADGSVLEATQTLIGEGHGPLPAQEGPHAHWILPLPDGRVLSTDLGADRIYVHHWDSGELVRDGAVRLAPGTGPRDMHLLPAAGGTTKHDWRVAVVGEWGNTVTLLAPTADSDATAGIAIVQTVELGGDPLDQAASLAFVPWSVLDKDAHAAGSSAQSPTGARAGALVGTATGSVVSAEHNGAIGAVVGSVVGSIADDVGRDSSGIAYVGLRGSERIVALGWDGQRLNRLAATNEPGWQGHGVNCGGSRPRHILPIGNLLLVANEVSNTVTAFALAADGEPTRVADLPSGSPTVFVQL